jgi:riboflavin synthase
MFTGIVERTARVISVVQGPKFMRLTLPNHWDDVRDGESIAVNGVCLTVAEQFDGGGDGGGGGQRKLGFDVIKETLDRTNLGMLAQGDAVNVERTLRVGDRIDGHFVQGHVDGVAPLVRQINSDREWRLVLEAPYDLAKFLAPKGSVCVDGVSLTIAAVDRNLFEVALIPTTINVTTLGGRAVGWPFNVEADILSKTVVHYLEVRDATRPM